MKLTSLKTSYFLHVHPTNSLCLRFFSLFLPNSSKLITYLWFISFRFVRFVFFYGNEFVHFTSLFLLYFFFFLCSFGSHSCRLPLLFCAPLYPVTGWMPKPKTSSYSQAHLKTISYAIQRPKLSWGPPRFLGTSLGRKFRKAEMVKSGKGAEGYATLGCVIFMEARTRKKSV